MRTVERETTSAQRFWLSLFPQLRYRMPKAVTQVRVLRNNHSYYVCPECGASLEREYMAFCVCCGQRLNWDLCETATVIYVSPKQQ